MLSIIIALIIIGVVTLFSVQNAAPVAVSFLFWKFESSLAIVIFLSALAGVIAGVAIALMLKRKPPVRSDAQPESGMPKQK